MPILAMESPNNFLSSAFSIDSLVAPINSTSYLVSRPASSSSNATFKAVGPPIVGRMASGFSLIMIFSTVLMFIGSI